MTRALIGLVCVALAGCASPPPLAPRLRSLGNTDPGKYDMVKLCLDHKQCVDIGGTDCDPGPRFHQPNGLEGTTFLCRIRRV
jgi:hypothetical protein